MNILFLSHYFYPEGNAPATRVYNFCREWVKEGHKVTVITCAPNVPNGKVYSGYKNKLYQIENMEGIKVIRVWTYIAPNSGTSKRIINYLSYMISSIVAGIFIRKIDLVISTSPQFFCGWAGLILSKLKFKRNILEIRDIWPDSIIAVGAMKKSPLIHMIKWLEMKMYKYSTKIVTVGEGYKRELIQKGVDPSKISVVSNSVDSKTFYPRPPSPDILQNNPECKNKFICSYIGTIGMASGLDVVLKASEKLQKLPEPSNIHFLLIGSGAILDDLKSKASNRHLKNISFLGLQPKHSIPDYIAISDIILVHLKKQDLFKTVLPSKMIEAFAMSKPILLGVEGFAKELLEKAQAGVSMEPENEDELIQQLKNLKDQPENLITFGKNGLNYVEHHFKLKDLAHGYLDIIEAMMHTKKTN